MNINTVEKINRHMKPIENALKTVIFTTTAQSGVSFKTAIKLNENAYGWTRMLRFEFNRKLIRLARALTS